MACGGAAAAEVVGIVLIVGSEKLVVAMAAAVLLLADLAVKGLIDCSSREKLELLELIRSETRAEVQRDTADREGRLGGLERKDSPRGGGMESGWRVVYVPTASRQSNLKWVN